MSNEKKRQEIVDRLNQPNFGERVSGRFMFLPGTPIVAIKRPDLKIRQYALGRIDTKELWCIGSFNKQFADMYDKDDIVYLAISSKGKICEHHPEFSKKKEMTEVVRIGDDGVAIVGIKFDNYWLVPNGFKEWAEKIF